MSDFEGFVKEMIGKVKTELDSGQVVHGMAQARPFDQGKSVESAQNIDLLRIQMRIYVDELTNY